MISLDDLKAHLGTDQVKLDPDRDTVLPALEAAAVDFVERETGRHFSASATFTDYLDGSGTRDIWLREAPSNITSVHERCEIGDDWEEIVEGDADGFELRGRQLLRKGGCTWERGYEYRAIYDFGYTGGQEPKDIRQLVTDLVALRWRQRGIEGHASGTQGSYSFTVSDLESIPGASEVIDRWRGAPVVAG